MMPSYVTAYASGLLEKRAIRARAVLRRCLLCPRDCRVDRAEGQTGCCRTGRKAKVAACQTHFGEESVLVGRHGSGTIFMSFCNLLCTFCQNYDISHGGAGEEVDAAQFAAMMLALQGRGCHNINLVTPTHVVPQILDALVCASEKGLRIPIIYNCSGYEKVETLRLLDGIVDIYMPDFKFWDETWADRFCRAPDYPARAREALREMHRQVGDLQVDESGVARRGLLVRHLVMPHGVAGSREIMGFLAREISTDTYVNIMDQYRPRGEACLDPLIDRPLQGDEYQSAVRAAQDAGLKRMNGGGKT